METFLTAAALFTDPYLIGVVLVGTVGGVLVGAPWSRSRRSRS
jgi:putative tricarboxylic transport membrane protein